MAVTPDDVLAVVARSDHPLTDYEVQMGVLDLRGRPTPDHVPSTSLGMAAFQAWSVVEGVPLADVLDGLDSLVEEGAVRCVSAPNEPGRYDTGLDPVDRYH